MQQFSAFNPDLQLFDHQGARLYLTSDERTAFLRAARSESPEAYLFCLLVHYTGCRPNEALELTIQRVLILQQEIVFRTIKKRKLDRFGNLKRAQYRHIPVPKDLIDYLNLVFSIREKQTCKISCREALWGFSRATAWRLIKRVMERADIHGKQATTKGLRHGFGIAMLTGEKPMPINILRDLMGHSDSKTTEAYLQAVGSEKRQLVMQAWNA